MNPAYISSPGRSHTGCRHGSYTSNEPSLRMIAMNMFSGGRSSSGRMTNVEPFASSRMASCSRFIVLPPSRSHHAFERLFDGDLRLGLGQLDQCGEQLLGVVLRRCLRFARAAGL